MKLSPQRLVLILALFAFVAFTGVSLRPQPVAVETARAVRGPLRVTIDEEGETRVRHRYVLSAPVAGRLERIDLEEGDAVKAGQVVARIDPAPLDARGREQAEARLAAALAAKREAAARVAHERAALAEAQRRLARAERLAAEKVIPAEELDAAGTVVRTAESNLEAASFHDRAAAYEAESARAGLLESRPGGPAGGKAVELRSPVAGKVLRLCQECEKVVAAGAELVEIGDPRDLEVVVDVLSSDAVKIRAGTPMLLDPGEGAEGGGREELRAEVRVVEPSGFTKISPLGVEEQRVDVIGDLAGPPGGLGDRYRVEARIVLWEAAEVLKIPAGAAFRDAGGWSVFAVEDGRARLRAVKAGHRNPDEVEILAGLEPDAVVVLHPSDAVADGVRVRAIATSRSR